MDLRSTGALAIRTSLAVSNNVTTRLLTLALSLFVLTTSLGATKPNVRTCAADLAALAELTGPGLGVSHVEELSSVRFKGQPTPGRHGGHILHVTLALNADGERMQWASDHAERSYDLQGDPRWFIDAVGADAAAYFGFKRLSDWDYLIPDADEFAGALAKVNAYLKRTGQAPFAFEFYVTKTAADVGVTRYVERVARAGSLPLAPEGNHLLHDLAFHTGILFAPKRLGEIIRAEMRLHFSFFRYLEAKYRARPDALRAVRDLEYVSAFTDTVRVDQLTGNQGVLLSVMRGHSFEVAFEQVKDSINVYRAYPPAWPSFLRVPEVGPERATIANAFLYFLIALQSVDPLKSTEFFLERMNYDRFNAARTASVHYPLPTMGVDYADFLRAYRDAEGFDLAHTMIEHLSAADLWGDSPSWFDTYCAEVRAAKEKMIRAVHALEAP